jgi:putative acetyltransferase
VTTVRPETVADHAATRDVVAAAFGDEPVAELLDGLRGSGAWRDLSFVAEQEGRVVGHVSFTRGWLDAPTRLVEVLVLSPLSVHPARQGGGAGSALVRRSLELLRERPEPLVFLEGSPAAFQFVDLASYEPWMTGALVYPDVFWEHDAVGLREETAPAGRAT